MNYDELVRVLRPICEDIGIGLVGVERLPTEHAVKLKIRLHLRLDHAIDEDCLPPHRGGETLIDEVYTAQRLLFSGVAEHMRKHDRDPFNRLTQIEGVATKLIAGFDALDVIGIPSNVRGPLEQLRMLVQQATGKLSWSER